MFGASNLDYAPHGDSTNSCHNSEISLAPNLDHLESEIKKLTQRIESYKKEQRTAIAELEESNQLKFEAIEQMLNQILQHQQQQCNNNFSNSESRASHQHKIQIKQNLAAIVVPEYTSSGIQDPKIQKIKQSYSDSTSTSTDQGSKSDSTPKARMQIGITKIDQNSEFDSTKMLNHESDQTKEEEVDSHYGGSLVDGDGKWQHSISVMAVEVCDSEWQSIVNDGEQIIEEAFDLNSWSGAEVVVSATGKEEAYGALKFMTTSGGGFHRRRDDSIGPLHRVLPLVSKPPKLLAAVLPWDRESEVATTAPSTDRLDGGTSSFLCIPLWVEMKEVIGRKQDEVVVIGADRATGGAIDGGTRDDQRAPW